MSRHNAALINQITVFIQWRRSALALSALCACPHHATSMRRFGVLPLSGSQKVEYARRKLEIDGIGNDNSYNMSLVEATEQILKDSKYKKMASNPLILSMIVSLMDVPQKLAAGVTASNDNKSGGGGSTPWSPLPHQKEEDEFKQPFRDKPSMFNLAMKMSISGLEMASGLRDSRVRLGDSTCAARELLLKEF